VTFTCGRISACTILLGIGTTPAVVTWLNSDSKLFQLKSAKRKFESVDLWSQFLLETLKFFRGESPSLETLLCYADFQTLPITILHWFCHAGAELVEQEEDEDTDKRNTTDEVAMSSSFMLIYYRSAYKGKGMPNDCWGQC